MELIRFNLFIWSILDFFLFLSIWFKELLEYRTSEIHCVKKNNNIAQLKLCCSCSKYTTGSVLLSWSQRFEPCLSVPSNLILLSLGWPFILFIPRYVLLGFQSCLNVQVSALFSYWCAVYSPLTCMCMCICIALTILCRSHLLACHDWSIIQCQHIIGQTTFQSFP